MDGYIGFSDVNKYYKKIPNAWNWKKKIMASLMGKYEAHYVLKNISFGINQGEKVALLGPNGSGKSTTMKLLSGILAPNSGVIVVNGHCPQKRENRFLKSIGLLAGQKSHLWWDLPAIDSFKLMKALYEISDEPYHTQLNFLIDHLDIRHLIYKQVRKLSLGERVKMDLTLVLLHMPAILFLDEPTIALDYKSQQAITEILNMYNQKFNTTILLTSHYLKDVAYLCDRVIILNEGTKIFDNSLHALKQQHACYYNVRIVANDFNMYVLSDHVTLVESTTNSHLLRVEKSKLKEIITYLHTCDLTELLIEAASIEEALEMLFIHKTTK